MLLSYKQQWASCSEFKWNVMIWAVAYAGFSKGGRGGRKFENNEDKKKFSIQKSCPKLGEDQKKGLHSNLVQFLAPPKSLHQDSVRLCAQTFCPSYKRGGGGDAALLHTILCELYYLDDPKGEDIALWPPLNTPLDLSIVRLSPLLNAYRVDCKFTIIYLIAWYFSYHEYVSLHD